MLGNVSHGRKKNMLAIRSHGKKDMLSIVSHGKSMVDVFRGKTCLVSCLMGRKNDRYRVSWKKKCLVSCLVKYMLGVMSHWKSMLVIMSHGKRMVDVSHGKNMLGIVFHRERKCCASCLMEKDMLCIVFHGKTCLKTCRWTHNLGILSYGTTCFVSGLMK